MKPADRHFAAPPGLNAEARRLWKSVLAGWTLDQPGGSLLANACIALTRLRAVQAALKREGLTVKDRFGQVRPHPLLTAERDLAASFRHDMKTLGLDPNLEEIT